MAVFYDKSPQTCICRDFRGRVPARTRTVDIQNHNLNGKIPLEAVCL